MIPKCLSRKVMIRYNEQIRHCHIARLCVHVSVLGVKQIMPNKQRLEELQNYTDKIANRINQLRCQQRGTN